MIIEFRVSNFRSISEEQILSFEPEAKISENEHHCYEYKVKDKVNKVLKSAFIFGPNASGKTNILYGIEIMRYLVLNDKGLNDDIDLECFKCDQQYEDLPLFLEMTFIIDNIKYIYGFEILDRLINKEWLYYYPEGNKRIMFERDKQRFRFTNNFKGPNKTIERVTDKKTLFITKSKYNNHEIGILIFNYFFSNFKPLIEMSESAGLKEIGMDMCYKNLDIRKNVTALMKKADPTIKDMIFEEKGLSLDKHSLLKVYNEKVVDKLFEQGLTETKNVEMSFVHSGVNGNDFPLDFIEESNGVKATFNLLVALVANQLTGGVLLVDEIEAALHPGILSMFLELFYNKKDTAQMIATSHNSDLLDSSFLRRDEIWFTERRNDFGTDLFSLVDIKPIVRVNENIKMKYLYGNFGAVPEL